MGKLAIQLLVLIIFFVVLVSRIPLTTSQEVDEKDTVVGVVDPRNIKIGSMYYYSYIGSLTTPPFTENVMWAIAGKVSTATREQVRLLRVAVHDDLDTNAMPTQPINSRSVKILIPEVKDDV